VLFNDIFGQRSQFYKTKFHYILLGTWEHFHWTSEVMTVK